MGKRLVLYVPDNRQAQVDEWRDELNYSKLFFEAFDRAVAIKQEIRSMNPTVLQGVVERLKEQASEAKAFAYDIGVKIGAIWAQDSATKHHLRAVAGEHPELAIGTDYAGLYSFLEQLYEDVVDPDSKIFPRNIQLWDENELEALRNGFIDGATEIWDAVAEYL